MLTNEELKKLGIDPSQVDLSKAESSKVKETNTPNKDRLKAEARKVIYNINDEQGTSVNFITLTRQGKTKDGQPRYIPKKVSGSFTIDKNKDGTYTMSQVHYYSESFKVVDITEVGKRQTSQEVSKELSKSKK